MTTAFQIGAFQFTGFQEERQGSGGAYRPIDGWGLRHALEWLARRRKQQLEEQASAPAVEEERPEEEVVARVAESAPLPRTIISLSATLPSVALNLRAQLPVAATILDIDAELEEFRALMKMVADIEDAEC